MQSDTQVAPQLTVRAIVLAMLLAMLLAAANTYLGLFAGMTIASAIPAAVISMAVLRVFGGGGILENNIVSTGASAGSSIASGVIFTIPALLILGYWTDFLSNYAWLLAIAGLGGLLGVLFSVPLRRSLIVDQKMAFPEGKAAAEVLKTGENPGEGLKILGLAAFGGGLAKLCAANGLRLFPDTAAVSTYFGKTVAFFGTNVSPALLGVGYIVGLNVGTLVFLGGVISWCIAIPLYSSYFLEGNAALLTAVQGLSAEEAAYAIWSKQIRYLGVGAMLVGGLWAVVNLRSSILSGVKSGLAAARGAQGGTTVAHTEKDLPMSYVLIGIVLFTLPLALLYQTIVGSLAVSLPMTIIMIVAGFVFCSVSAYMAGLVGSSNNPVSGITICTILFAALVLLVLMGKNATLGPIAAIMIGAVVCCAACISGDNLQDLKCGQIVGATPWKQQVMLGIGAASCALIMAPVLHLLDKAYGIGVPTEAHPDPLLAPQATLMASVAKGIFGGALPWTTIAIGGAIGIAIIIWDLALKARNAKFRAPVLAVAVGIYLPLELSVPIFLGGLLSHLVGRALGAGKSEEDNERLHRKGMLFSAGMITGEALMGIVIALAIYVRERPDALALPESLHFGGWLGLLLLAALAVALYRTAIQRSSPTH